MFYFVPSWYKNQSELLFDDTVNQIKMFYASGEIPKIVMLNYAPQLPFLLHQQELFEIDYWSAFDEIQMTNQVNDKLLNIADFSWPKDAEFIYTPFNVNVMSQNTLFAQISFGAGGHITAINFYDKLQMSKRIMIDVRGFVSSIIYFEQGQPRYQDYLNPAGVWQIRQHFGSETFEIEVNTAVINRFKQTAYGKMDELLSEVLDNYFNRQQKSENDALIIAADKRHNQLLLHLNHRPDKVVLSLFKDRFPYAENMIAFLDELKFVSLVVVDTQEKVTQITQQLVAYHYPKQEIVGRIVHLSPYDTRFKLGRSQQSRNLDIFIKSSQFSESEKNSMNDILDYMLNNVSVKLFIATNNQNKNAWDNYIRQYLSIYFHATEETMTDWLTENGDDTAENSINTAPLDDVDSNAISAKLIYQRISIDVFSDENKIIKLFEHIRLIIDLNPFPDIFIQIAGISAGIPQINRSISDYVENRKNGFVIDENNTLNDALDFYLKGLKNWNEALIYSVKKIEKYNSGAIVKQWQEMLGNHHA